ncbi:MAG: hypothetical protein KA984_01640 [Candidatus Cloacimonetes bacterium]|nr:hypothetical protein [Candidatus Cloacimonadota bacterium]
MKYCVALIIFMFSLSLLFSVQLSKVKVAANLYWISWIANHLTNDPIDVINGAQIGVQLKNSKSSNRESFVNALYSDCDFFRIAGINYEVRVYKTKNFYIPLTIGADYVETDDFLGEKGKSTLYPHATFGFGYRVPISESIHLYIEWDAGIKALASNINIGLTL